MIALTQEDQLLNKGRSQVEKRQQMRFNLFKDVIRRIRWTMVQRMFKLNPSDKIADSQLRADIQSYVEQYL